jgi:rhamnulokinase
MDNRYYLAVDIGASSGRHILSHMENGKIILEEVYRFHNGMTEKDGHKIWDVDRLFEEILTGMKKCSEIGKMPYSIGIDTWAVDFVLLDNDDRKIMDAVAYRDDRTAGIDKKVYEVISEDELYARTGIQKQNFNTIYQLMAVKSQEPDAFEKAKSMLMIPDYLNFLLTGEKVQEYTNATTTQLVNPVTKDWDYELIDRLGYPKDIFGEIKNPGSEVGKLRSEVSRKVGFDCKVILPATHDTASAVMAVPTQKDDTLYISSGTWSLMGTELVSADCSSLSMEHNLTNEGGYDYRFRYLKNIMGLWMIQSVRKEIVPDMSFGQICELASKEPIKSIVDVNDNRFLAPLNMTEEVKRACAESGQQVPDSIAQIAAVIYNSLAECYASTVKEIEGLTHKNYEYIHIVGGGANAGYLNELTANETRKRDILVLALSVRKKAAAYFAKETL